VPGSDSRPELHPLPPPGAPGGGVRAPKGSGSDVKDQ
jgi:hypothetical protein